MSPDAIRVSGSSVDNTNVVPFTEESVIESDDMHLKHNAVKVEKRGDYSFHFSVSGLSSSVIDNAIINSIPVDVSVVGITNAISGSTYALAVNHKVIPSTVFAATESPSGIIHLHEDDKVTLVNVSGLENILAPPINGTVIPTENGILVSIVTPPPTVVASLYLELVDD